LTAPNGEIAMSSPQPRRTLQYATPVSRSGGGIVREGNLLVVPASCVLPKRCIKCNAPAGNRHDQVFNTSSTTATVLFGVLGALLSRKATAQLTYFLCDTHEAHKKRKAIILWSVGLGLAGLLALALVLINGPRDGALYRISGVLFLGSLMALLAFAIVARIWGSTVRAVRVDQHRVKVRGITNLFGTNIVEGIPLDQRRN
jgi:hypothetical protein